jgi:HPt (histidine-containing phosphotransfer) domain-containing protein
MSAAHDVLDLTQILAAFGEIDEDVREMMHLFVETTAPMLEELEAFIVARDQAATEDHAHSIKGAARSAGARAMASASEAVEIAARAGDWAEVELKLALIRPAFDAARQAIARL